MHLVHITLHYPSSVPVQPWFKTLEDNYNVSLLDLQLEFIKGILAVPRWHCDTILHLVAC